MFKNLKAKNIEWNALIIVFKWTENQIVLELSLGKTIRNAFNALALIKNTFILVYIYVYLYIYVCLINNVTNNYYNV